jgi:adenosylcobinamide-GDP ribazoletransferase
VSGAGTWPDATRLAVGTLTIVPVRPPADVDRAVAQRAMSIAPVIGLVLGGLAASVVSVGREGWAPLVGATLAVGLLAVVTRGLHLDGLADTADGLGSGRPAPEALALMRRGDIGPFGVVALILVLLLQIGSIAEAPWWTLLVAVPVGRVGLVIACSARIPPARPDGLGAAVAGSVPWWVGGAWALGFAVLGAVLAGLLGVAAVAAGLLGAAAVTAYAVHRLGGVTGDVLGAVSELSTTATLLVLALQ